MRDRHRDQLLHLGGKRPLGENLLAEGAKRRFAGRRQFASGVSMQSRV
jgi:hypothetical protein